MENISFEAKNISVKEAARIMGKSEQFIRQGLIEGYLPIGMAVKRPGSSHYCYYIIPKKLYDLTGYYHSGNMSEGAEDGEEKTN